ncbi:Protein virilizer-like protein [Bienertia sinuspersici]
MTDVGILRPKVASHDHGVSAVPNLVKTEPAMMESLITLATSFSVLSATDEESKKAAAAAVAAKLTASTSSAQMLSSVLSSLVAEEAAKVGFLLTCRSYSVCWYDDEYDALRIVSNTLPPPPPLPSHGAMGLARPPTAQSSQPLQPPQQLIHQQNASGGFYRPPGIGLYGSSNQPSTPPVQRQ